MLATTAPALSETFTIDTWGNMTNENPITGKTGHEGLNTTAGLNNQLAGYSYDPAGNMTINTSVGATYTYDAENRLVWTSGYRYVYDGDGERVEKCLAGSATTACPTSGTNGTLYWRGDGSDTLDESDLSGNALEEYIFFNGERVARRDVSTNVIHYYFSDHLGTHAVVTDATGTQIQQDIDYYPYGAVQHDYATTPVAQNYKFNGKERDTESGLDNFGARFDASYLGRFMTPDWAAKPTAVPYAHYGNPQSLNLYSYVQNNPTTLGDPDGHQSPPALDRGGTACSNGILNQCSAATQLAAGAGAQANTGQTAQPAQNQSSGGFWEKLGNFVSGNGWKTDAELHPSQSPIDKDKVANYMDAHAQAKSGGRCATACRQGMEAGGLNTTGHPVDAKDYGPFLTKHGASAVSGDGYKPEKGDVAVFSGNDSHPYGHIEIYDGKQWVSDFKQNNYSPYRTDVPDSTVYRFPD